MSSDRVIVAAIAGAHGVSGRVKLKTFTEEPASVGTFGPLSDEAGERQFEIRVTGSTKGGVIAELSGIRNRDQAEALKGTTLHVDRERLPELEDEEDFYQADLIGLEAIHVDGQRLGRVKAVHTLGAGEVLEIQPALRAGRKTLLVPFSREAVPVVDIAAGRLTIDPPVEIDARPEDEEGGEMPPEDASEVSDDGPADMTVETGSGDAGEAPEK
ncbi:MAG: ribosome maturation factor RimM [Minwuia sp.]|nr:ribosome maturation factor RimM [Minwuia sp.]